MSDSNVDLAAPCGLYCGACIDYVLHKSCHGCNCQCEKYAASEHRQQCDIYSCIEQKNLKACSECEELPCSRLIRFCYHPVWLHHLPVIENLRRRRLLGTEKWLMEQKETWGNEWYLRRWLWLQKRCERRHEQCRSEVDDMFSDDDNV